LDEFINCQSKENYEKLIGLAIQQIYSRKVSVGTKERAFEKKVKNLPLENFKKLVKEYEGERKKSEKQGQKFFSPKLKDLMLEIQTSVEEVFVEIKKLKEKKHQAETQLEKIEEIDNETRSKCELSSKYNENDD
jgi:hypothetical protein